MQDIPELPPQFAGLRLVHRRAAQPDTAAVRRIDALEEFEQGGFARAVVADDGRHLAMGDREGQIVQHRLLGNVAERDALQPDILRRLFVLQRIACLGVLLRAVQQHAHILQSALGALEGLVVGQHLRRILVHPPFVGGEIVDAGLGHFALPDQIRPAQRDDDGADGVVEGVGQRLDRHHEGVVEVGLVPRINGFQSLRHFQVLHRLGLDVFGRRDMLGEKGGHHVQAVVPPEHHLVLQMAHQREHQHRDG